jgi:carboxypeptidase Taq
MGLMLKKLKEQWAKISRLEQTIAVLSWDMETYMPEQGVKPRSEQLALLSELAHQWLTSDETARCIENAEREVKGGDYFSDDVSMVRVARRTYDQKAKIPRDLVARMARTTTNANSIWMKARLNSDFPMFEPVLAEIIDLNREQADMTPCLTSSNPI